MFRIMFFAQIDRWIYIQMLFRLYFRLNKSQSCNNHRHWMSTTKQQSQNAHTHIRRSDSQAKLFFSDLRSRNNEKKMIDGSGAHSRDRCVSVPTDLHTKFISRIRIEERRKKTDHIHYSNKLLIVLIWNHNFLWESAIESIGYVSVSREHSSTSTASIGINWKSKLLLFVVECSLVSDLPRAVQRFDIAPTSSQLHSDLPLLSETTERSQSAHDNTKII